MDVPGAVFCVGSSGRKSCESYFRLLYRVVDPRASAFVLLALLGVPVPCMIVSVGGVRSIVYTMTSRWVDGSDLMSRRSKKRKARDDLYTNRWSCSVLELGRLMIGRRKNAGCYALFTYSRIKDCKWRFGRDRQPVHGLSCCHWQK